MTDPQGRPRRPRDPLFVSSIPGFRRFEKVEKSWLTSECRLIRSAAPNIAAKTSQEISGAMWSWISNRFEVSSK
jgi:hypothetical protein